jgi:hypothetical protein
MQSGKGYVGWGEYPQSDQRGHGTVRQSETVSMRRVHVRVCVHGARHLGNAGHVLGLQEVLVFTLRVFRDQAHFGVGPQQRVRRRPAPRGARG